MSGYISPVTASETPYVCVSGLPAVAVARAVGGAEAVRRAGVASVLRPFCRAVLIDLGKCMCVCMCVCVCVCVCVCKRDIKE